jgi:hypothetical protein
MMIDKRDDDDDVVAQGRLREVLKYIHLRFIVSHLVEKGKDGMYYKILKNEEASMRMRADKTSNSLSLSSF